MEGMPVFMVSNRWFNAWK